MVRSQYRWAAILLVALGNVGLGNVAMGQFNLPNEGSMLPDVKVYDEHGKQFSTKSLRGHYSVLVFGCLT